MAAAATTWWRASTRPTTMAAQLRTAIDDSICRRVAEKTRRARRSARTDAATTPATCAFSRSSVAWVRTVVRLAMVSAITPVACEWVSENSCSAATTLSMRRQSTPPKTTTSTAITTATGHATTLSTTTAPTTVAATRRRPQVTMSTISTKAHEKVSSDEMTSPEGRSVCHRWLSSMRWS